MTTVTEIFQLVVDASWRSSWLILLVLGLRYMVRGRISSRLIFGVWIVVALRLLVPLSLPAAWSPFNPTMWSWVGSSEAAVEAERTLEKSALPEAPTKATSGHLTSPNPAEIRRRPWSASEWAALIWLAGVAVLLFARGAVMVAFARRLARSSRPLTSVDSARLGEITDLVKSGSVPLLVTDAVTAPALHGIVRPRILFPRALLENLSLAEVRLAIAHELAHARRRDLLVDGLMHLATVVHWFNPLVWLAARAARQECELACDESVLHGVGEDERESYGAALLRITKLTTRMRAPGFTLGVVTSRGQIKRRIQMIIANKSYSPVGSLLGGVVAVALVAMSLTSATTAQIPSGVTPAPSGVAPTPAVPSAPTEVSASGIVYNPSVDRLDVLYPTGTIATVADRSITVSDVRNYIAPLVSRLQSESRTQEDFNGRLAILQNSAVNNLVSRALLVRQFHDQREGETERRIAEQHIDDFIAGVINDRFEGDRSKYLEYLKSRGMTQRDYRKEVEEMIIFNYMRAQERKISGKVTSPVNTTERPLRLRIIQLNRSEGDTDESLRAKAGVILARFQNGESFETLAREFDDSKRKDRGGDWGWVGADDLRVEYRDIALGLRKGDVSVPILTKEGCFLFYADDRR